MENIISNFLEFIKTDSYIVILSGAIVILLILYITSLIRMNRIKKSYKAFMEKIGNGTNIEEILEKHIDSINKTITKNEELEKLCIGLDNDIKNCIQKVGIYKYNAYKDTGSDLSFTVALLDERNDGIVMAYWFEQPDERNAALRRRPVCFIILFVRMEGIICE